MFIVRLKDGIYTTSWIKISQRADRGTFKMYLKPTSRPRVVIAESENLDLLERALKLAWVYVKKNQPVPLDSLLERIGL